jgi:hypothetical protein
MKTLLYSYSGRDLPPRKELLQDWTLLAWSSITTQYLRGVHATFAPEVSTARPGAAERTSR